MLNLNIKILHMLEGTKKATGLAAKEEAEVDTLCAMYIKALLEGKELDMKAKRLLYRDRFIRGGDNCRNFMA